MGQFSLNPKTGLKCCQKCHKKQPAARFDPSDRAADKLRSYCKGCRVFRAQMPVGEPCLVLTFHTDNNVFYGNVVNGSTSLGQAVRVCPIEAAYMAIRLAIDRIRGLPNVRERINQMMRASRVTK